MASGFWTTSMSEAPNGLMRGTVKVDFGRNGEQGSLTFTAEHYVPRPARLTLKVGAMTVAVSENKPSARSDHLQNWAYGVLLTLNNQYCGRWQRGALRANAPETSGTGGYLSEELMDIFVGLCKSVASV